MQVGGVDIRLVRAADFKRLAILWRETYADGSRELPLSVFYESDELDLDIADEALKREFS